MAEATSGSSDNEEMAGGYEEEEEADASRPKAKASGSSAKSRTATASRASSTDAVCFLCDEGGLLTRTYRSKSLHKECFNAVRSHTRAIGKAKDTPLRPSGQTRTFPSGCGRLGNMGFGDKTLE